MNVFDSSIIDAAPRYIPKDLGSSIPGITITAYGSLAIDTRYVRPLYPAENILALYSAVEEYNRRRGEADETESLW